MYCNIKFDSCARIASEFTAPLPHTNVPPTRTMTFLIVETVCRHFGEAPESIGRRTRGGWLRAVAARMLSRHSGLTQREIALRLGVRTGKAASVQLSRLAIALKHDRWLARQVGHIEKELRNASESTNA
jgi:hypothetical protein